MSRIVQQFRILIVDNNSPFVLPLLRSFSSYPEFHVDVLLIGSEKAKQFRFSRFMGQLIKVDELNDENIQEQIKNAVSKCSSNLLIPTREWLSALFYRHHKEISTLVKLPPLPSTSVLAITSNKWELNSWLKNNGFPYTHSRYLQDGWDFKYPVLLKPLTGIGGEGIRLLHSKNKLKETISNLQNPDGYFLQEFKNGEDRDISFFAVEGKIIYYTQQKALIPGKLAYSKGIEFIHDNKQLEMVESLILKLGFTGIAHLDFRYSPEEGKYFLIDFNARYWSSLQGSQAMGINFPVLVSRYVLTGDIENCQYRSDTFYFSSTAARIVFRRLGFRKKHRIRFKNTQLAYICKDPLPELFAAMNIILRLVRKVRFFRT